MRERSYSPRRLRIILALGLLALTLLGGFTRQPATAQAGHTWYVNTNCTACGEGTRTRPFRTIGQAQRSATEGDTILVAQGVYYENLLINTEIFLMGGYAATSPNWVRDIARYKTTIASDDRTVPGDWNGDWLGSPSVIKDGSTYRMWYSAGNDIDGESIGHADSPDGVTWFNSLDNPLLAAGPLGAWDESSVANPAVLATGSGFLMMYVGTNAAGGRAVGAAVSPDGLTWQKYDGNPVLSPDSADGSAFGFPTVVQDSLGSYKMWYSGGGRIWLATSSDGLAWTKHLTDPALSPGPSGAWDDGQVYTPRVIAAPDGYRMWYVGKRGTASQPSIGYAWSSDGLNWHKSPANPVLSGTADTWEQGMSDHPAVIRESTGRYRMWYRAGASGQYILGEAWSSDGVAWVEYAENPVLSQGEPTHWGAPVVSFRSGSNGAALDGLTITGGYAEYGGGIWTYQASPIIRNCTVSGNMAANYGGGIWLGSATPRIENTVVQGNIAAYSGGGIHVSYASATIQDSLIEGNAAEQYGGGISMGGASQPTLVDTVIARNRALRGGGLNVRDGVALDVHSCRIEGNMADRAAGGQALNASLAMTNTLIVDNRATIEGPGALRFWSASGRLVNVTIADNSARDGRGGVSFQTGDPSRSLVILNSILVLNGSDDLSCSGGTCSVTYSDVQEGYAGTGNIAADPRFVDRAGGDYHLRSDSPAIDAGTNRGAPATDFEGDRRPTGTAVDMGADEYTGTTAN